MDHQHKHNTYYSGARTDYIDNLPCDPNCSILEIGCGEGDTGAYALSTHKCGYYAGIEINSDAASIAKNNLSSILLGDIEKIDFIWPERHFDVLICSEVLEHLIDPWATLDKLTPLLRKNGLVKASSPNVSHYSVIYSLLKGQWRLSKDGIMDSTHLRWFTPESFEQLFANAGFAVDSIGPVSPFGRKSKFLNSLTIGKYKYLFMRQINLLGHLK